MRRLSFPPNSIMPHLKSIYSQFMRDLTAAGLKKQLSCMYIYIGPISIYSRIGLSS